MKSKITGRNAIKAGLVLCVTAALMLVAFSAGGAAGRKITKVRLRDTAGNKVGVVRMLHRRGATEVRVEASGLAPGFHGFHVHATGVCDPGAVGGPFTSAGGHFNPTSTGHGDHAGDMPVLLVMEDGTAGARFLTDRFTVDDLRDADGSAIIVHAGRDNYANIPTRYHSHTEDTFGPDSVTLATGDAGARVACGVVDEK